MQSTLSPSSSFSSVALDYQENETDLIIRLHIAHVSKYSPDEILLPNGTSTLLDEPSVTVATYRKGPHCEFLYVDPVISSDQEPIMCIPRDDGGVDPPCTLQWCSTECINPCVFNKDASTGFVHDVGTSSNLFECGHDAAGGGSDCVETKAPYGSDDGTNVTLRMPNLQRTYAATASAAETRQCFLAGRVGPHFQGSTTTAACGSGASGTTYHGSIWIWTAVLFIMLQEALCVGLVTKKNGGHRDTWFGLSSIAMAAMTVVAATVATTVRFVRQKEEDDHSTTAVRIKAPLRNTTPLPGERSKIVYLTGIDKQSTQEELIKLFSVTGTAPIEVDLSEVTFQKGGGRAWALYHDTEAAQNTVENLHGANVRGCTLCARLELGVENDGNRITDNESHTAILRNIQTRRGTPKKHDKRKGKQIKSSVADGESNNDCPPVTYSHKSISVGPTEYPFPSGLYLTRLIQILHDRSPMQDCRQTNALLDLLSDVSRFGTMQQYAKELSEAFAMVDALKRAMHKLKLRNSSQCIEISQTGLQKEPVICYCLGDGKYPVSASALALSMPDHWSFVSIDPILEVREDDDESFHNRIQLFRGMSQDYKISASNTTDTSKLSQLSIAVACHSHAPLQEFWDRMTSPKLSVAMPCCAQYSELATGKHPLLEYDNFEVYSPKRRVVVHAEV
jgi:hypothetical protein